MGASEAKVELLDRHFAAQGFLDESGEPIGATKVYFVAVNSARSLSSDCTST